MRLAFACPFYGPTHPLVGHHQRELLIHKSGHEWVADISTINLQHRQACDLIVRRALDSDCDAVFWTEHDIVLPPYAAERLAATLTITQADMVSGVTFRRCVPYAPMISKRHTLSHAEYAQYCSGIGPSKLVQIARDLSHHEMQDIYLFSVNEIGVTPFVCDAASFTCLLIRREALQRLSSAPNLFAATKHASIDTVFFNHASKLDLALWCDPNVLCGHLADPAIIGWQDWEQSKSAMSAPQPS